MSREEALELLYDVAADYTAMAKERHRLLKLKREFDPNALPLIVRMHNAIANLRDSLKYDKKDSHAS